MSMLSLDVNKQISAGDILDSQLFPKYFAEMYEFLAAFHLHKNWNSKLSLTMENISKLLSIPDEGFDLVLPFLLDFFSDQVDLDLRLEAASSLFDSLGAKLGLYRCKKTLLSPIVKLYHVNKNTSFLVFSYNKRFKIMIKHWLRCLTLNLLLLWSTDLDNLALLIIFCHTSSKHCVCMTRRWLLLSELSFHAFRMCRSFSRIIKNSSLIGNFLTIKYVIFPLLQQLSKSNPERAVLNLIDIGSFYVFLWLTARETIGRRSNRKFLRSLPFRFIAKE
jgi:hypothetical protein